MHCTTSLDDFVFNLSGAVVPDGPIHTYHISNPNNMLSRSRRCMDASAFGFDNNAFAFSWHGRVDEGFTY
jgi:hypothetical protein